MMREITSLELLEMSLDVLGFLPLCETLKPSVPIQETRRFHVELP